MSKTVLFLTIQLSISTQFSSVCTIDRTLSGVTTLGQNEPESNGTEGVLRISQSSRITGVSPSDCLVSYPGHSLRDFYLSAEMQSGLSSPKLTGQYQHGYKFQIQGCINPMYVSPFNVLQLFFRQWKFWITSFNGMSIRPGFFYALRLEKRVYILHSYLHFHVIIIIIYYYYLLLESFSHQP